MDKKWLEILDSLLSKKAGLAVLGAAGVIYCGQQALPVECMRWVGGITIAAVVCQFAIDLYKAMKDKDGSSVD